LEEQLDLPVDVYVVEFQGQTADAAWYNLLTTIGLYGEQHPKRDVVGIGVFLRERDAPAFPRWAQGSHTPLLTAALDRFLPEWLACEPDNPYVAVFAPLMIDRDEDLRAQAPTLWRTVQTALVTPEVREVLSQVLEFWFFERFRGLTAQEIWAMLNLVTPIQETRAYQSIFAEGEATGKVKGKAEGKAEGRAEGKAEGMAEGKAEGMAEGKASVLKRLAARRFGPLPEWARRRIEVAPVAQLDGWLDGIFDAETLVALIGPEAS